MFAANRTRLCLQLAKGLGRSLVGQTTRNNSTNNIVRQPILARHIEYLNENPLEVESTDWQPNPVVDAEWAAALQGLSTVVGVNQIDVLLQYAPEDRHYCDWEGNYWDVEADIRSWSNIKRGKDVFVPGLQAFNIPDVYNRVVQQQYKYFARSYLIFLCQEDLRKLCKNIDSNYEVNENKKNENVEWLLNRDDFDFLRSIEPIIKRPIILDPRSGIDWELDTHIYRVRSPAYWMVALEKLQAFGHFQHAFHLMEPGRSSPLTALEFENDVRTMRELIILLSAHKTNPPRRHLFRYQRYWNDLNTIGSLHELVDCIDKETLNRIDRFYEEHFVYELLNDIDYRVVQDWPEGGDEMHPNELLNSLRKAKVDREMAEIKYSYLDDAPDAGNVSLLRSKHEIGRVADALHNCAAMYARKVERKQMLLAVLKHPANGKPMALGSIDLPKFGESGDGDSDALLAKQRMSNIRWGEIREHNNRSPSKDTVTQFDEYLVVLKKSKWCRDFPGK